MIDPRDMADRLVHDIDPAALSIEQRLQLARIYAAIAVADEHRTGNLLSVLNSEIADDDLLARRILAAVIRRRIRVLPPPAPGEDATPNGGE